MASSAATSGNAIAQVGGKAFEGSTINGSTSSNFDEAKPFDKPPTSIPAARARDFEEVIPGDRAELRRIATGLRSRSTSFATSIGDLQHSTTAREVLTRKDTLHNVNIGDPVLDPTSPEFDGYKWARM